MMVIWAGLMPIWRRISGSTPWPIEPKPIMTMRPLKSRYLLPATFFAIPAPLSPGLVRDWSINGDGAFLKAPSVRCDVEQGLDADRLERGEAVEGDRRVGRRVGAGRQDLELVAGLQRQRQLVLGLLVEDVGRIAGRAGQHDRAETGAVARGAQAVLDALVHGLGQAGELADVEVDPALALVGRL